MAVCSQDWWTGPINAHNLMWRHERWVLNFKKKQSKRVKEYNHMCIDLWSMSIISASDKYNLKKKQSKPYNRKTQVE